MARVKSRVKIRVLIRAKIRVRVRVMGRPSMTSRDLGEKFTPSFPLPLHHTS